MNQFLIVDPKKIFIHHIKVLIRSAKMAFAILVKSGDATGALPLAKVVGSAPTHLAFPAVWIILMIYVIIYA